MKTIQITLLKTPQMSTTQTDIKDATNTNVEENGTNTNVEGDASTQELTAFTVVLPENGSCPPTPERTGEEDKDSMLVVSLRQKKRKYEDSNDTELFEIHEFGQNLKQQRTTEDILRGTLQELWTFVHESEGLDIMRNMLTPAKTEIWQ